MVGAILFYSFAAVIVISALLMVSARNVFHSALWLALCLFGVAAIFVLLNAYFLAGIQLLLYVGAVVVLALFVINLTKAITGKEQKQVNAQVIPAILVSMLTGVLILLAVLKTDWSTRMAQNVAEDKTATIGRLLLTDFVVPFEVVSVLLLAALIGAIVIVAKDEGGKDDN